MEHSLEDWSLNPRWSGRCQERSCESLPSLQVRFTHRERNRAGFYPTVGSLQALARYSYAFTTKINPTKRSVCWVAWCTAFLAAFMKMQLTFIWFSLCLQTGQAGLPWWSSGWGSACRCRGHGFEPWSGRIPRAAERLGPWATTTEPAQVEPVLHNKRSHDNERSHRNEKPTPCDEE